MWQLAGKITVKDIRTEIRLRDYTGFDGRCDAIFILIRFLIVVCIPVILIIYLWPDVTLV